MKARLRRVDSVVEVERREVSFWVKPGFAGEAADEARREGPEVGEVRASSGMGFRGVERLEVEVVEIMAEVREKRVRH